MKTVIGIAISLSLLIGVSAWELYYVDKTFDQLHEGFTQMYQKTEAGTATHEDGNAMRIFWEDKKQVLHIWLPHTIVDQLDTHLNEALGYLYQGNFEDSLPKFEVLIDMTENIPYTYDLTPQNIF